MSNIEQSAQLLNKIADNIEKLIVGKRTAIELTIITLISSGHILIEDVPGIGKTSLVSAVAKSINAAFNRIQFTPDILPSDITGFSIFNRKTGEFEYKPGSIMSQIILADEINRGSPKTQSSLLEAMEENQVTVDGTTYQLPHLFMVLATQNPVDFVGTYPLPEAQLDRFLMKISLGYPLAEEEYDILMNYHRNTLQQLQPVTEASDILRIQEEVKNIFVAESIFRFIIEITNQTRNHPDILLGCSPRGSIALYRATQAHALYNGRDYAIPDDVMKLTVPVLSHRILLKHQLRTLKGHTEEILHKILETIPIP